jgi:two-component system sensor histidine kinase QseC
MRASPSIRGYLTRTLLLVAGLLILLCALVLDWFVRDFLLQRFDQDLLKRAQSLISLTVIDDEGIEFDYPGEFMPEFEGPEGPEFFEIWLPDGSLLERSESMTGIPMDLGPGPFPELRIENVAHDHAGRCRALRISFVPQVDDAEVEDKLGPDLARDHVVTLILLQNRDEFDRSVNLLRLVIWCTLLGLLGLVVLLVRYSLRRGLAPLNEIGNQAKAISPQALETRLSLAEPVEELTPIVAQLNGMLGRLEEGVARERRFTSDVAHELRTPLAELRSLSEVATRDPGDKDLVMHFFQDVREVTLEMQALVTNLLELSRCDSGSQKTVLEMVCPYSVLERAWRRVADEAAARPVYWKNTLSPDLTVLSDARLIELIFQNLINNAVIYSPVGSCVTVEGDEEAGRVRISNPAPDLEPRDLDLMFERFWQKSASRTGGKNAGLGLALVQSFAEMLGLDLRNTLDQGRLTFILTFLTSSGNELNEGV